MGSEENPASGHWARPGGAGAGKCLGVEEEDRGSVQAAVAGGGHCLQARPEPPRRMGGQGALDQGKGSGATHCGVNPWGDRLGLRRREASSFSLWKTPGLPAGPAPLSPPGRCAGRSPPPRTLGRLHESWGNAERTGANRGRRRTLPQPSAGLRPRGEAAGLLPSPPSGRWGYRTPPRPRSSCVHRPRSPRPPGVQLCRDASGLPACKGTSGPGRPHPCGRRAAGHPRGARTPGPAPHVPRPRWASGSRVKRHRSPPCSWGEKAFPPSPYGHFLSPCSSLSLFCPSCHLPRLHT